MSVEGTLIYVEATNTGRGPKPETKVRYDAALELYRTTDLSIKAICKQTKAPYHAFRNYILNYHRELMFARHGISITPSDAVKTRLRKPCGQTAVAHAKYREAIAACDDAAYIEYNVSQIARIFHLNPSSLGHQLHIHYPEVLERREKTRHQLGINDNFHRGVKAWCKEQYAEAVEHLRTTDDTIPRTAMLYKLSLSGLREYIRCYHKELIRQRATKRSNAKSCKKRGKLTGNGALHEPTREQADKYREALHLYRTTAMTQKEIVKLTGVTLNGLRNYLRTWNKDLIFERRGVKMRDEEHRLSETKHYLISTAAKYAGAVKRLKESGLSTAEVAREFGVLPETFRSYLHEHEPELAASLGMVRLRDGKLVAARSMEKYMEAIQIYEATTEPLKSIARRLGLQYNSVGSFIRRNYPEVIGQHNRLVEGEISRKKMSALVEAGELARHKAEEDRQRIIQALEQTGNNRRQAARLLGICKSTLYNKLKLYRINE